MKIGELARLAQCSVETVRYYEKAGLLPPAARSDSNYRHYGDAHVARLRFIRNCRALDMTHEEVRALLGLVDQPENSCSGVNRVLDEHIAHVDVRIRELRLLKEQLVALRATCRRMWHRAGLEVDGNRIETRASNAPWLAANHERHDRTGKGCTERTTRPDRLYNNNF